MADYFSFAGRRRGNSVTQERLNAPLPPGGRPLSAPRTPSRETLRRPPSNIRIRRIPSNFSQSHQSRPASQASDEGVDVNDTAVTGRRRSSSAPQRFGDNLTVPGADLSRQRTSDGVHMQTITEGAPLPRQTPVSEAVETPGMVTPFEYPETPAADNQAERVVTGTSAMASAGAAAQRARGLKRYQSRGGNPRHSHTVEGEYGSDVVDLLDLVDPEVRTIGTLTNLQNSLFVPDLGGLINRRPTYELSTRRSDLEARPRSRAGTRASQRPASNRLPTIKQGETQDIELQSQLQSRPHRTMSISSQMSESRYAVLPHGVSLEDWTDEEIAELNDHVRHLLHSRRAGFKRSMRGFRKYISKPLGLFVTVYATLVTLFGAAWVFCLIGWIYIGSRQDYFINVIDNVLVALFALIGDGMAPFRAVDTYHMCFIAHYHHLTWKLRNQKKLPNLVDPNDLPDRRASSAEVEDAIDKEETAEFSVLSPDQQRRLQYHQAKFSKAHTFYKPHETSTHHAFPLRLLVAVVVLLDCHSLFQVALGTCTWSINYKDRPQALTATILSCSITSNIVAGVIISIGDKRTRKKEVLERIFRQGLTEEAIEHVQRKHTEHGREGDIPEVAIADETEGEESAGSGKEHEGRATNYDPTEAARVPPGTAS